MIEIEKPRIETEELTDDGKYGRFVVEPLERGFGNTLGNSLRRVLLSSLEGCAVTSIKIDGVLHEFSTLPGVKEDITEIALNIKSIVPKLVETAPKVVEIAAEGPCKVTAGDIKHDAEVEILNPDLHIATLAEDAKLNIEITLDRGRGYVPGAPGGRPPFPRAAQGARPACPGESRCPGSRHSHRPARECLSAAGHRRRAGRRARCTRGTSRPRSSGGRS